MSVLSLVYRGKSHMASPERKRRLEECTVCELAFSVEDLIYVHSHCISYGTSQSWALAICWNTECRTEMVKRGLPNHLQHCLLCKSVCSFDALELTRSGIEKGVPNILHVCTDGCRYGDVTV